MSTPHLHLIQHIENFITLQEDDKQAILEAFETVKVKKNTLLEQADKKTNYLYFIESGYVRVHYLFDGEERTTQINCPSKFITSYQSFITQTPAYDNVSTITDCILLRITKSQLEQLNDKVKNWSVFGEKIYEQALVFNEGRTRDMILLNAEERYQKLMEMHPDIILNVPLQYIASYIGIKPESLSRIRKSLNS